MKRPKILLTGGSGQLGTALEPKLASLGDVFAPGRSDLDLSAPETIEAALLRIQPHLVINCAAYTSVDLAESEREKAFAVNAAAAGNLSAVARKLGASFIQVSTDYVFDGAGKEPYREEDATAPINVYGESKLAGERMVLDSNERSTIVRVAWLYGVKGKNFLRTMLRLAETHSSLRVVDDQFGAPCYVDALAEEMVKLAAQHCAGTAHFGTFHLPSGGSASWCDFARSIFAERERLTGIEGPDVVGIPTEAYPTPAARPRYSVLSGSRAQHLLGLKLPPWEAQLKKAMERLYSASDGTGSALGRSP